MKEEFVWLLFLLMRYSHGGVPLDEFTLLRLRNASLPGPTLLFNTKLNSGILEFHFKTFEKDALVLYQDDEGFSNFIEISLQEGKIRFVYNIGTKKLKNSSRNVYNDFKWHYMRLEHSRGRVKLNLPDEVIQFDTSNLERSQFTSVLQIGGFPKQRYKEPNSVTSIGTLEFFYGVRASKRRFFNACVKNIRYSPIGGSFKAMNDVTSGRSFAYPGGCKLTQCDHPKAPCDNKGVCSIEDSKVQCDCRWTGYEGKKCRQRALELSLNGTYVVKYFWEKRPIFTEKEKFKFRIKTKERNAVIMKLKSVGNVNDKLVFEIRRGRMKVTVNLGSNDNYLWGEEFINDGKWHVIYYQRTKRSFSVSIDNNNKTKATKIIAQKRYTKLDYGGKTAAIHIGEIALPKYRNKLLLQDFILTYPERQEVDFVRTLFNWLNNHRGEHKYEIYPKYILPTFNRKLQNPRVMTPSPTPETSTKLCIEGDEEACEKTGATAIANTIHPKKSARTGEEKDSSITWIIVVTVICSLILFAGIAFLVYRWNKRYSGDFQINKKEIGPSGTVVHYKDTCYTEKQRPTKI